MDNNLLNSANIAGSPSIGGTLYSPVTTIGDTTITTGISNNYWGTVSNDDTYATIKVAEDYIEKEILKKEKEEILSSIKDFCNEYCFQGCEGICDGETKSQCPLWNRLKCEKKV